MIKEGRNAGSSRHEGNKMVLLGNGTIEARIRHNDKEYVWKVKNEGNMPAVLSRR